MKEKRVAIKTAKIEANAYVKMTKEHAKLNDKLEKTRNKLQRCCDECGIPIDTVLDPSVVKLTDIIDPNVSRHKKVKLLKTALNYIDILKELGKLGTLEASAKILNELGVGDVSYETF